MSVFLNFEHFIFLLEHHADFNVESFGVGSQIVVVGVFHRFALPGRVKLNVDICFDKFRVEIFDSVETARQVNHRAQASFAVDEMEWGNTGLFRDEKVIGAESAGNMHNAGAVGSRNICSGNNPECSFAGIHPRNELFVVDSDKVRAFGFADYFPGDNFVTFFIGIKFAVFSFWI